MVLGEASLQSCTLHGKLVGVNSRAFGSKIVKSIRHKIMDRGRDSRKWSVCLIEACSAARLAKTCGPAGDIVVGGSYQYHHICSCSLRLGQRGARISPNHPQLGKACRGFHSLLTVKYSGGKWSMWGRKMLISACLTLGGRAALGQAKCQLRNANRATNVIAGADVYLKALSAPGQKFYSFVLQTPRH